MQTLLPRKLFSPYCKQNCILLSYIYTACTPCKPSRGDWTVQHLQLSNANSLILQSVGVWIPTSLKDEESRKGTRCNRFPQIRMKVLEDFLMGYSKNSCLREETLAYTSRNSRSYMRELFLIRAVFSEGFWVFCKYFVQHCLICRPAIHCVGGCWV